MFALGRVRGNLVLIVDPMILIRWRLWGGAIVLLLAFSGRTAADTRKAPLHGRHWMAITGKPLSATAGARMFENGGNAVDAACAMLGAGCVMFDDIAWGGETQALIYDPRNGKVVAINALGVAPTDATPEYFRKKGMQRPPSDGPLAALTPGTVGGLMVMLSEYGTMSLKQVLEPAMQMADGFPVEEELAAKIDRDMAKMKRWPYSRKVFALHPFGLREGPRPGEIFRQADLLSTLQKLVDAEADARKAGKDRKKAIQAAYDRFYKGDIAAEFVRGSREMGGLHTMEDLARWEVKIEEPVSTTYKGIEVYKLSTWTQGPVLLQMLNMLESMDVADMGYNSARYIHTLYQVMNLAYADRDFYYGDPSVPPQEPIKGLLSKPYALERLLQLNPDRNNARVIPGDPYPYQGGKNPYLQFLTNWINTLPVVPPGRRGGDEDDNARLDAAFRVGTTTIQAMDKAGWAVSVTPSGGWIPACIAGNTGVAMSQRMQSFVLDEKENPFNVMAPGKRPRVTLSPGIAVRDGKPLLCFGMQGGDWQDQHLLQFFLNVVEFSMSIQQACEARAFTSSQMRASFDRHESKPGRITLNDEVPSWVRQDLLRKGYRIDIRERTTGPITAIFLDPQYGTFWGGCTDGDDDHGITW
jgi:gamma-glutamyltranspeptidase/glutathione hydrolase